MPNTVAQDIIYAFTNDPAHMYPAAIVAIAVGYIYYVYAFLITVKEKTSPLPLWLHCFFLADDTTACVVFYKAAQTHAWFGFFVMFSAGMLVWNFFEIFCNGWDIKHKRQEIFGAYQTKPVTVKDATLKSVLIFLVSLAVVNLIRVFTYDEIMFFMFTICNILAVTIPPLTWAKNKSRKGASMGWAILMIFIAFTNFLPPVFGMWTTASSFFDKPWYIAGVIMTAYSIGAAIMLSKFPKKELLPNGKKPIW